MGIFTRIRPHLSTHYILGVEKEDFVQNVKDKCITEAVGIKVANDGRLNYKDKPLTFAKDLLIVLSDDLVGAGYPHTLFMKAGQTLEVRPACWMIMSDEDREEFLELLSGSYSFSIREFRNITI